MRLRPLILAGALVTAWACGGSSSSMSPTPTPTPGPGSSATLHVMLKDSPFSDAKALLVKFSEVSVHASGGDWMQIQFASGDSRTCDLKKLTTAQDILGIGQLAAGHYTQLRLMVSSATIYFGAASSGPACAPSIAAPDEHGVNVDIPSGELRLNREFDLASATTTMILLDFDGDRSVRQTGNGRYMMTPVIGIVSVQ